MLSSSKPSHQPIRALHRISCLSAIRTRLKGTPYQHSRARMYIMKSFVSLNRISISTSMLDQPKSMPFQTVSAEDICQWLDMNWERSCSIKDKVDPCELSKRYEPVAILDKITCQMFSKGICLPCLCFHSVEAVKGRCGVLRHSRHGS